MRDDPVVSILLPVRDAEDTLDSCFASLVDQTFPDWECVAIDDHSTDRSRAIMDVWAVRDPRIRVFESPQPGGIIVALEEARRRARGALLARQDADDRSLPMRLGRQVEAMREDETIAVVGCRTQTPGDLSDGMRRYLEWIAACTDPATCGREIWIESPIAHPTAMIRAAVLDEVGGYRDLGWPEDYDLWLRVHRIGGKIMNVSQVLYEWTDHSDRLSRRDPRYAPEAFLRCRVHHLCRWLAERGTTRPLVVWGAGRDGRRLARAWEIERTMTGPSGGDAGALRGPALPLHGWDAGFRRGMAPPRHSRDAGSRRGLASHSPGSDTSARGEPGMLDSRDRNARVSSMVERVPEIVAFVDVDPRKIGRRRRGRPILDPESARRAFPDAFYLAAVGVPGARESIRAALAEWGMAEEQDFLCLH